MRRRTGMALGLLAVVVLGVWTYESFRSDVSLGSERGLLLATQALMDDTRVRPAHVRAPTNESLDNEKADLAALEAAKRALIHLPADDVKRASAVLLGSRPLSDLPDAWTHERERLREPVARILGATHGTAQALPPGLRFLDALGSMDYSGQSIGGAADLAVLEGWEQLAASQVPAAAGLCTDLLALGRDVSSPHVLGQVVGGMSVVRAFPLCSAVINRADAQTLDELEWSLKQIEAGWTPLSTTLHNEAVFGLLTFHWETLSRATQQAMPPPVQAACGSAPSYAPRKDAVRALLIGRWARREAARAMDLLIDAASQPVDVQDAAFRAHAAHLRIGRWFWSDSAQDWLPVIRRIRTLAAQRLLLRAGAATRSRRLHESRWPTQLPADWVDPRTGLQLDLRPDPATDGLQLVAVASSRHDAPELVIHLLP